MLGKVVQVQVVDKPVVSTRLKDAILENFKEVREGFVATLEKQEDVWKEFWLNASGTSKWCPRMAAFQAMFGSVDEVIDPETRWNFEQGHVYHELFQNKILPCLGGRFLGGWDGGDAIDDVPVIRGWSLPEGHELERGFTYDMRGDRDRGKYVEVKIRIPEYRIVVKLDGVLDWGDGLEVFELKTEREAAKESLNPLIGGKPRQSHVEQVMVAMWASGIRRARIVYMFKGEGNLSNSIVEHVVEYDESMVESLKATAKACVEAVRSVDKWKSEHDISGVALSDFEPAMAFVKENFLRLEDCPMKSKGRARYCIQRNVCFQK